VFAASASWRWCHRHHHFGVVCPAAARLAANRPIVEVLHFVGAGDSYIANRSCGIS